MYSCHKPLLCREKKIVSAKGNKVKRIKQDMPVYQHPSIYLSIYLSIYPSFLDMYTHMFICLFSS